MTDGYKIKRVLIWQNGTEKQIYPAGWQPGAQCHTKCSFSEEQKGYY